MDYRHEYLRKQMGKHEIDLMCAKYESECKYKGSRHATEKDYEDMLKYEKPRKCSYT